MSYKLFIPGPIAVSEKTLRAMAQPMIGHRSPDFVALYQSIQPDLQALFYTKDPVYLSTSSAWGVMEGSLRNVVKKKVLNCMNGAFSDKWYDVAVRCGKAATALKFEWGQPVDPEAVRAELAKVVADKRPAVGAHSLAWRGASHLSILWLRLPLATNGRDVDMILGYDVVVGQQSEMSTGIRAA
jgi:aspartate aminotransferase-like enzyme